MNLAENLTYSAIGLSMLVSGTHANIAYDSIFEKSFYHYESYSINNSSTLQNSPINLTDEFFINQEIERLKTTIQNKMNTSILDTWYVKEDLSPKTCLFVKCDLPHDIQNDFDKLSDFELKLYLNMQDELEQSDFFEMIALL